MDRIITGAANFLRDQYPKQEGFYRMLAAKPQQPIALFITCADSRVHPNLITQTEPGDLFLLRNAGNIVPPHGSVMGGEAATIEYAVEVLKVPNIIICGHSQCGAMQALMTRRGVDQLPAVRAWCEHAEATRRIMQRKALDMNGDEAALVSAATEQNVLVQLNNLSTHPCVAAGLAGGTLRTFGWYYDIGSGRILQYDSKMEEFEELRELALAANPMPLRRDRAST